MTEEFRCAAASLRDAEPMAGTAPEDVTWLLVEDPGPWGRQAVADSRLAGEVKAHLGALSGVRVQLIRRHGGLTGPGVRVFAAHLGERPHVWTTVLDDVSGLLDVDPRGLPEQPPAGFAAYDGHLWLVCTNGRRDRCCAEAGRPVAAALTEHWPEETWETTHLGGHRFSGTMLALPAGVALGRLDPESAVVACRELASARLPLGHLRGRVGRRPEVQAAELRLRDELGLDGADALGVRAVDGDRVVLTDGQHDYELEVRRTAVPERRQSCAQPGTKPGWEYHARTWVRLPA